MEDFSDREGRYWSRAIEARRWLGFRFVDVLGCSCDEKEGGQADRKTGRDKRRRETEIERKARENLLNPTAVGRRESMPTFCNRLGTFG
jgi:hypothetical protein